MMQIEQIDRMTAREILRGDEDRAAAIIRRVREQAAAKALSARPDDSAVEMVARALCQLKIDATSEEWQRYRQPDSWMQFERDARAAIAALGNSYE